MSSTLLSAAEAALITQNFSRVGKVTSALNALISDAASNGMGFIDIPIELGSSLFQTIPPAQVKTALEKQGYTVSVSNGVARITWVVL